MSDKRKQKYSRQCQRWQHHNVILEALVDDAEFLTLTVEPLRIQVKFEESSSNFLCWWWKATGLLRMGSHVPLIDVRMCVTLGAMSWSAGFSTQLHTLRQIRSAFTAFIPPDQQQ